MVIVNVLQEQDQSMTKAFIKLYDQSTDHYNSYLLT